MNNRGQALVEFVLILPVFLFILLAVIDLGMIFNSKSNLENDCASIVDLFKNGTAIDEIKKIYPNNSININILDEYYTFEVTSSVDLITPGFNRILGDPYIITVERVVPYV